MERVKGFLLCCNSKRNIIRCTAILLSAWSMASPCLAQIAGLPNGIKKDASEKYEEPQPIYLTEEIDPPPPHPRLVPGEKEEAASGMRYAVGTTHDFAHSVLLTAVYYHDPDLRKLVKKPGYIAPLLLVAAYGIYGISLGSGIYTTTTTLKKPLPTDVEEFKKRVLIPSNLTIINSGIGLASLTISTIWGGVYLYKIKKRREYLNRKVATVIANLSNGGTDKQVLPELFTLLGSKESAKEFLGFWHALHPEPEEEIAPLQFEPPLNQLRRYSTTLEKDNPEDSDSGRKSE